MAIDVDERCRHRYPRVRVEQQQQVARGGRLRLEGGLAEPKARVGSRKTKSLCSDQTSGCYSLELLRVALDVSKRSRARILNERIQNRLAPFQSALAQRRR